MTERMMKLIVCKCDRCGREMADMHKAFIAQIGLYYPGTTEPTRYELCGWCATELNHFLGEKVEPVKANIV